MTSALQLPGRVGTLPGPTEASHAPARTIVYSCTYADYDYAFGPLMGTPNTRFLRFGDGRRGWSRTWTYVRVPADLAQPTQTLTNRYFKFFPGRVLPDCDVAIYVDGNILVRADLTPLVTEFLASGADIALFPHPSGRTVEEEIDFALRARIPKADRDKAERQRERYRALGLLDVPVTENTILFFRMSSPVVPRLGEVWWEEMAAYTKRDQVSLPYVLRETRPKVHVWSWHFADGTNPYFSRYPHRRGNWVRRLRDTAFVMHEHSALHAVLFSGLKFGGWVRGLVSRS